MSVVNQYPFHMLPEIGLPSKDELQAGVHSSTHARRLTEEEKALIQSSFAWMQTSDHKKLPRPTTASYSELCFLLRNLEQMRIVTKMTCLISPHKEKYEATGQKHGFYEILYYDFSLIDEVIFNCTEFTPVTI